MSSKFARRAALATGHPKEEGILEEERWGPAGWLDRLLVTAQAPFFLGARISPRARLWVLAYRALTFPLSLWKRVHHFQPTVDGTEIRVVCVGRQKRFRDLLDGLFGPLRRVGGQRPRWAWRPRALGALGASLVAVDVHPWLAAAYRREGWLIVPENVRWQGDLSQLPPPTPPETLRSDMRKVERYGYRLEEAEGAADWSEFIERMALPHTRARYGDRAWFPGPASLEAQRAQGRLLFVRRDDLRVAGASLLPTPHGIWLSLLGTRDGDERWAREGALSAVYLLTFDWARKQGYGRFDAGTTRPFPNDGVARYKAKLGLTPVPNPLAFTNALRFDPQCASLTALLAAEPPFCLAKGAVDVFPSTAVGREDPGTRDSRSSP